MEAAELKPSVRFLQTSESTKSRPGKTYIRQLPVKVIYENVAVVRNSQTQSQLITFSIPLKVHNALQMAERLNYVIPSIEVQIIANKIFGYLRSKALFPAIVMPLIEGGIGFEFTLEDTYYNIKVDNEGDGVFYKEIPDSIPEGWDLNFDGLLRKVKSEF